MSVSLEEIKQRIQQACRQSQRKAHEIRLVGASKHQSLDKIRILAREGLLNFGENYVQELLEKQSACGNDSQLKNLNWHFIGQLQRKKIRQIVGKVNLIHSVDRLELIEELSKRSALADVCTAILIQVNLSGESSKGGVRPKHLPALIQSAATISHVDIHGLMTLPPATDDAEQTRPFFQQLRHLRDEINQQAVYRMPIKELSMGMSQDFAVAIEEGATLIRLGTILFGSRDS